MTFFHRLPPFPSCFVCRATLPTHSCTHPSRFPVFACSQSFTKVSLTHHYCVGLFLLSLSITLAILCISFNLVSCFASCVLRCCNNIFPSNRDSFKSECILCHHPSLCLDLASLFRLAGTLFAPSARQLTSPASLNTLILASNPFHPFRLRVVNNRTFFPVRFQIFKVLLLNRSSLSASFVPDKYLVNLKLGTIAEISW